MPKISVVIPVYNARAQVGRAIASVLEQSLRQRPGGRDAIEVIAVDDGSTDGTGAELDRIAGRHRAVRVVHETEQSGGPGRPRNVGIEHATGEYVFFLDSDDYLGVEALERMSALADDNRTDVVLGRIVGVAGRGAPRMVFRKTLPRTTVENSRVYDTLSAQKLFRRELIERHKLRFLEGQLSGEDLGFTAHAYFHADGISVLADYDCYYLVARDDGESATQRGGADRLAYFAGIGEILRLVVAHTEPGPLRDRLLRRHFQREVLKNFEGKSYLATPEPEQLAREAAVADLIERYLTPGVLADLPPHQRLCCHYLRTGNRTALQELTRHRIEQGEPRPVGDRGHIYLGYPGFRDPSAGLPDDLFVLVRKIRVRHRLKRLSWEDGRLVLAGTARIDGVPAPDQRRTLLIRQRGTGVRHRLPVADSGRDGGFHTVLDPAELTGAGDRLTPGRWDVHLELAVDGLTRRVRLGAVRDGAAVEPRRLRTVRPYYTVDEGGLALDVGNRRDMLRRAAGSARRRVRRLAGRLARRSARRT